MTRGARSRTAALAGLVALLALALAGAPAAANPGWAPDHAKLQLAGHIGFLSPGLGWSFHDRRIDADVFAGWVPHAIAGEDILSVTGKVTWQGYRVRGRGGWTFRPVTTGLQLTYWLGDEYFTRPPSAYPHRYYDFVTALRGGLTVGGGASWRSPRTGRAIGVYYELVTLDVLLLSWIRNPRALGPEDAFSLAIGTVMEF